MDLWSKARSFAEEAAKRSQQITLEAAKKSQEFTFEAAKRSQQLTSTIRFPDIVTETAKRSKEIAAEASSHFNVDAFKSSADLIKSLNILDPSSKAAVEGEDLVSDEELVRFGVSDDLREFVKDITMNTFTDFPLPDDEPTSDVPTVSNVRQDLTEWQAKHAMLVLSTVKEISKLRYELCPRIMKERKFWRIYFMLVNNHTAPYEKKYEEEKLKCIEQEKETKAKEAVKESTVPNTVVGETSQSLKKATSSAEQDLDVFLLGDLGESDDGPDDGDDGFDDDFDKIGDSSDGEDSKASKK